uniref:Uncharacterized protein n=1 Tax=Rhizophora mucronata TaxID=61149 RepID=A0A2P2IRL1_RHIMU
MIKVLMLFVKLNKFLMDHWLTTMKGKLSILRGDFVDYVADKLCLICSRKLRGKGRESLQSYQSTKLCHNLHTATEFSHCSGVGSCGMTQ